jgi:hypothetical protein
MLHLWGRGEMHRDFWWGNVKERKKLERLRRKGRIILRKIEGQEVGWGWRGGMEWIVLAQDMTRWRAVVNAVMNLRVL